MSGDKQAISLSIEGMTCTNCAQSIVNAIEKAGATEVDVNFLTAEAHITLPQGKLVEDVIKAVVNAGYKASSLKNNQADSNLNIHSHASGVEKRFYFSLIFTIPLFSHMFLPFIDILQNPILQLVLCIPVFLMGLQYFGKSAFNSIKAGIPNMDVLITMGFSAAFFYSLAGTIIFFGTPEVHNYLFYETAATIITLVMLGNVIEHRSVDQTTTAIAELSKIQPITAMRVQNIGNEEKIEQINYDQISVGDILLVNEGEKVPADGKIHWGESLIDESMVSGESVPVSKRTADFVIGGTLVIEGSIKIEATGLGDDSVLSKIIDLVKKAQQNKPDIQRLGDTISNIFVPVVIAISIGTFLVSFFVFGIDAQKAIMSSIAVLVISCPCAMGLATPTAVMAGIGRAAKNGILIKGGAALEEFAKVKTIVFDKTGTLTTGKFRVSEIQHFDEASEKEFIDVIYSLELHSTHPIAKSLVNEFRDRAETIEFENVEEQKGLSISGTDQDGNKYILGSYQAAKAHTSDDSKCLYLLKNDNLIAQFDISDEIKRNAQTLVESLLKQGIEPILLSGDTKKKSEEVGNKIGIRKIFGQQTPSNKLETIEKLNQKAVTAMVGDGINDAPALSTASVGVSLGNASQVAIESAQIILLRGNDLSSVNEALQISKHTYLTIKQNLFWALAYNVVAIPIAAMGFLNPMVGALAMAFSDIVVIGNSIRLKTKRINLS